MFVKKKRVFKEKIRCDTLDIQIQNLVHKIYVQHKNGTRESHILVLHVLDISCGT